MDCSFLPPCYQVLKQKLNRTNLITGEWLSSDLPNPLDIVPTHCGWILDVENRYKINWFEGDMSQMYTLKKIVKQIDQKVIFIELYPANRGRLKDI